jgi:uncharacterized protein
MLGGWPATVDPVQLADKGERLTGEASVKSLSRLAEVCLDPDGSVMIDLAFERSGGDGLRIMRGTVQTRVRVPCQRCLEPMDVDLRAEPSLVLLRPGEHPELVEAGEARVFERPVPLSELVEDELLLVLPMVPMHAMDRCPARNAVGAGTHKREAGRPNPFAVLGGLKRRDR